MSDDKSKLDMLLEKIIQQQGHARQAGFDWPDALSVIEKVQEELAELQQALAVDDKANIKEEFGDVLLTLVNLSLHLKLDIYETLNVSNDKFLDRYNVMLKLIEADGLVLNELALNKVESYWQKSKMILKKLKD